MLSLSVRGVLSSSLVDLSFRVWNDSCLCSILSGWSLHRCIVILSSRAWGLLKASNGGLDPRMTNHSPSFQSRVMCPRDPSFSGLTRESRTLKNLLQVRNKYLHLDPRVAYGFRLTCPRMTNYSPSFSCHVRVTLHLSKDDRKLFLDKNTTFFLHSVARYDLIVT